jgi:iron complex outermembrane receptor protein
VQDGEQRHLGAEVLAKGRFWDPLEVSFGVQYLHAEYVETGDDAMDGERPPGIPDLHAVLYATYRLPIVPQIHLGGGLTYVSERDVHAPNTSVTADEYVRLDLSARYVQPIDGNLMIVRLNVENVTDEVYYVSAYYYGVEFGAPLTATASLEFQF